ncbi:MAG TPA: hypothetical protein VK610_00880 [Rhodothermales bacterium]|nr:hypothetical protein [Rhodothermales bacterium]
MTALLAVDLLPGASTALATSAIRYPGLSVLFLDLTPADFVVLVESAEPAGVEAAVQQLTLRPGVAQVAVYPA